MGIARENENFCGSETDFPRQEKNNCGEQKLEYKNKTKTKKQHHKKTRNTDFSSPSNTRETTKARSHMAITHFSRLIVNTATDVMLAGRH